MIREPGTERSVLQLVTCQIGGQTYALPLDEVLQVVRLPRLTQLAGTAPELCGFLNLRGAMLPVLAGRILVDEPMVWSLESHIIVLSDAVGNPAFGLLVDAVDQVRRIPADRFVPLHHGATFIQGSLRTQTEQVLLFDPFVLQSIAHRHTEMQVPGV
jgi:purine-binding chemotaxis protein CheW